MPFRSKTVRNKIEGSIRRFKNFLRYKMVGPHALKMSELKELVRAGWITPSQATRTAVALSYLKTHAKMANVAAPKAVREGAIEFLERLANRYADKMSTGLATDIQNQLEAQTMPFVNREEGRAIYNVIKDPNIHAKYLGDALRSQVTNWNQRWKTIVRTELARASNYGAMDAILENNKPDKKGPDQIQVFKIGPNDGLTCEHCKRFWFMPDGVTPKAYLMSELISGGTNIGVKARDWKPTIDSSHPNCRHIMAEIQPGYGFRNGKYEWIGDDHNEYEHQKTGRPIRPTTR